MCAYNRTQGTRRSCNAKSLMAGGDDENKYAYALFDCGVEEGHYFSEDWLFCSRWTKLGGKVYVDVTINLTHTGVQDFKGSFVSTLV